MWAVVPIKSLGRVKQRLAEALSQAERTALFRLMAQGVLEALREVGGLDGILVVTRDPEVEALAGRFGARILRQPDDPGHTGAVMAAARQLTAEGADGFFQVPGDLPLIDPGEIETVLAAHRPAPAFTIVPSADEMGSNCVVLSPPDAVPLSFGEDSFRPHLAAAEARGLRPTVLRLPGLALDIDTPADLSAFLAGTGGEPVRRYLEESGIADRVRGARTGAKAHGR